MTAIAQAPSRRLDGKAKTKVTDLLSALDKLRLRTHVTTIDLARSLLIVAQNEGLNVSDYARALGIPKNSMSRNLLDLGPRNRHMGEGLGLVEGIDAPMNLSHRLYHLTDKGRDFMADLTRGAK